MFSFFHRTSKLHVDAFTCSNAAYKYTPIINSFKSMPEWMDSVPKSTQSYGYDKMGNIINNSRRSIRTCKGFIDLYKRGFILESWGDLKVDVRFDGFSYHYTNGPAPVIFHPDINILPGFERHYILKLSSPWMIRTKERIPFVVFGTEWSLEHIDAKIIPGSQTFADDSSTNVFLVFKKPINEESNYTLNITIGEPLQQFVPLTERKIKIHNHLISSEELDRMRVPERTSVYGWRKLSSLNIRNEKREKRNCPFDFF